MEVKNWKLVATAAGGIVAIASALAVLGLELPRPAWASEVYELVGYIAEVDSLVTSQQLDDTRLRLYANERERNDYISNGQRPPAFLNNERVLLERKIEELENRLDEIREKLSHE